MQTLQQALEASLEDHSISRSERKELNPLLALTQGDRATQAKVRQFAFDRQPILVIGDTMASFVE